MSALRAARATWAGAFREAFANRRGFWTQVAIMVANDVVWVTFWVIFFDEVGEVRGWNVHSLLTLLAIVTTGAGLVLGLTANVRRIGELASDGGLDATLALPVPPLLHLLTRRVYPSNLGDVLFGIGLFVAAGDPSVERTARFVLVTLLAAVLLTGFLVLVGSLAFFAGRNDAGELGFHSVIMFASYPVDIFSGATKLLLYTAVPAGFISAVPARLVGDPQLDLLAGLTVVAFGVACLGWLTFTLGLRRYTSGSIWTRA